ncbi:hypothetical protein GALMADRAFT_252216 [Galerina marginata CBS 339.88]|uniref:MYND-type domain-containing protein n=1 Tax=Galerina marginata (strain CBS 339.88) TaxID=685588 RepID=A0A067SPL7_GALM3|nr:hypothetical protein GALMADRAFT_252216 [Galerina marginata CBS 339.88]
MTSSSRPQYRFESVVHPERDAAFKRTAPSKRIIKELRKDTTIACTNCGRLGNEDDVELKKCSGCKVALYCSTDCQKQHWSEHKPNCSTEFGQGIGPLIGNVIANPMLSHFIQVCLCLKFNLHNLDGRPPAERTKFVRSPLLAHMDVGIEPTMIADFNNLFTYPDTWDKDDLEGMLQFHNLSTGTREQILTDTNAAVWKQVRDMTDQDGGKAHAVVLVQFVNNFKQSITCPIVVGQEALDMARDTPTLRMASALTGEESTKPFDIPGVLEYMNTHIRSDKKNKLLLRTPMREIDKELIRQASRNVQSHAPQALRLKVGREHVYLRFRINPADGIPRPIFPLGEDRQAEGDPEVEPTGHEGQEPPTTGNRAERRRLEREFKKEQKKRRH